ncbi:MAG: hypothetical protein IKN96_05225 [Oscillibacter sp.]|nr:hypothetical protein [Oscillibacter sp.]
MSIDMSRAGYNPAAQAARTARYARTERGEAAATETAENAEAKSGGQQSDAFEPAAGDASHRSSAVKIAYKMDEAAVSQLKADLEERRSKFLTSVKDMLTKQGIQVAEGEGIWKQIAEGKVKADDETAAAAKEATSEDGYWGVKQTSERFIKYAKALTGGDPAKAEAMREAFKKGYGEAEKAWGGKLPELSQKTYDATMKLFDEWAEEGK